MLAALIMFGLRPGPDMFTTNAALVWAVIASMFIGNLLLLVMNLPLAGVFARLLQIRYSWIYPPILAICLTGVISRANNVEDAWLMLALGVLGSRRYNELGLLLRLLGFGSSNRLVRGVLPDFQGNRRIISRRFRRVAENLLCDGRGMNLLSDHRLLLIRHGCGIVCRNFCDRFSVRLFD